MEHEEGLDIERQNDSDAVAVVIGTSVGAVESVGIQTEGKKLAQVWTL